MFRKATPILVVEAIEPCLPFWEALGFQAVATVPHGDRLGFVILQGDAVGLMYQTHASIIDDLKGLTVPRGGITYIDVADLALIRTMIPAAAVAVPERTTFYGATEIYAWEPGGNLIGFSHHPEQD
ncbi:MAG: hypothetical protein H7338_17835 [Candidatus Sericytochromatia bacterium]|nr:hypothetical protein [Candidatus Sericytochromatia bacterium]